MLILFCFLWCHPPPQLEKLTCFWKPDRFLKNRPVFQKPVGLSKKTWAFCFYEFWYLFYDFACLLMILDILKGILVFFAVLGIYSADSGICVMIYFIFSLMNSSIYLMHFDFFLNFGIYLMSMGIYFNVFRYFLSYLSIFIYLS